MTKEELLQMAIKAVKVDKISVLPCGKDKVPLVPWKVFTERFPTEEEIRGWFERFPEAQVGFICGEISGITVVDVEAGGEWEYLPETFTVKTGGQGYHMYYKYQEGMQNKARIKPLTDIRGDSGFVVAPGSTSFKGSYEIIKKMPPVPFPMELFKPIESTVSQFTQTPTSIPSEIASDSFFLVASYPGYGKGQRNEQMTSFIGRVFSRVNPLHWETHGFDIICKANEKNDPPLPRNEVYASFRSIKSARLREAPIYASPVAAGAQIAIVTDGSDEVKHISTVAGEQKMSSTEVFPTQMEIFDEALKGGFRLGNIVIVVAITGHGKTSIAQDWTMSFTTGEKRVGVLWFSYEVMVSDLWDNFKEMGMTDKDIAVIPAKHSSGNIAWVEAKIKEAKEKFNIKVVVIDHLGFLLPKTIGVLGKNMSLNQAAFVTQIVRDLKTLAIQEEIIIILPVHVSKMKNKTHVDQEDIKDSSGVAQEADCVFLLEREKNKNNDVKDYYTENTRITLSKNRKYGHTPSGWFTMINRRFAYSEKNEMEKKAREGFEEFITKDNF